MFFSVRLINPFSIFFFEVDRQQFIFLKCNISVDAACIKQGFSKGDTGALSGDP